jgi:DNA-binding transcriptional MerR regulator
MPYKGLSTSKIARAVGCHPNTVRLYEQLGFLPPVRRSRAGYRLFNETHLDQMRLARAAMNTPWAGRALRTTAVELVRVSASGNLGGALELAYRHLAAVRAEHAQAEIAAQFLERWAQGSVVDDRTAPLNTTRVAQLLGVTVDALRTWERNNLLVVPRNPANRYRLYGAAEIGRLRVIRMLRTAGYSIMSILRMLIHLEKGKPGSLRDVLDTPNPDEDIYSASDRWLTTLAAYEQRAGELIVLLEEMLKKQAN